MKELWHFIEKILGVYRWHPKIALRYLPVVDFLRLKQVQLDVLEVGSSGLGIAPYLKEKVVGLDVVFHPPYHHLLIPVKGSATQIPFTDSSFAAVISLDMLEHISAQDREAAVSEMMRVARKVVCIGVPCGQAAHEQDELLQSMYHKKYSQRFQYLEEQVEYDLPKEEEILSILKDSARKLGKNITIKTQGNINLRLRLYLMNGWMSQNMITQIFFRKILLLAIPMMRYMNKKPTYRTLFFVTIES